MFRSCCLIYVLSVTSGAAGDEANATRSTKGKTAMSGETVLYNGIRLPKPWPPRVESLSREPMAVPYLTSPPDVIPIDVGRQLFVDDFLVQETTLRRSFHLPTYHPASPVLRADEPWERESDATGRGPFAMPFSDGVWYDPAEKRFKMWYHADYGKRYLCYATSQDGIRWEKPSLDVVPGTNIVLRGAGGSRVVWLDLEEKDPTRRYKLITTRCGGEVIPPGQPWWGSKCHYEVHFSADGIHWGEPVVRSGPTGDRNTAFYNPFRKTWVYSIREYSPHAGQKAPSRTRRYWESSDLVTNMFCKYREAILWVGADRLDLERPPRSIRTELYNLDAVAYESVMLGLFTIMRAWPDRPAFRPKINEVCVGFSRDGFHWHRPDRRSFLPVSEDRDDWNWGNVQSVGGGCVVMGDKLYFYTSGRKGNAPKFHDAGGSTGIAVLRRDGFASMDAADTEGTLTTRPVTFTGKHLFVNADVDGGELCVEALDGDGQVIAPFGRANGVPVRADSTIQPVLWQGAEDLSSLVGRPVRFRFHLRKGRLFAFWVSPDDSGASHGYVAAGGPGFTGPTDTVGTAAYAP